MPENGANMFNDAERINKIKAIVLKGQLESTCNKKPRLVISGRCPTRRLLRKINAKRVIACPAQIRDRRPHTAAHVEDPPARFLLQQGIQEFEHSMRAVMLRRRVILRRAG